MLDKAQIGARIAALRKELGYTQAAYAEKLNVSTQAVSKWETGLAIPDLEVLLNIAWMSQASIHTILEGEGFIQAQHGIDRGLALAGQFLNCPACNEPLSPLLPTKQGALQYACTNGHNYPMIDGVLHFGTREMEGELWSLAMPNYAHYLAHQRNPGNPRYWQGEPHGREAMWRKIQELRPRTILDMACGTGSGIKYIIGRINWPVTILMTDLSHRVLKWNRAFLGEEWKNPYVDLVYLACDCSRLPLADGCMDMIFSNGGLESMQSKMIDGFREAYRVLKPGGHGVYNMSVVEDYQGENTRKWLELCMSSCEIFREAVWVYDIRQWLDLCRKTGFRNNDTVQIYGELPAPSDNVFPFENEISQWMAEYVVVSEK